MSEDSIYSIPKINNLRFAKIIIPGQKITDFMLGPDLAPEFYKRNGYDQKVDTWNFGAIIY